MTASIAFAHVGLHKTATTWLQTTVFSQNPHLVTISPRSHLDTLSLDLHRLWTTNDLQFDSEAWQADFSSNLAALQQANKVMGVSNENLSGHMLTGERATLLADRLQAVFGEIKIILVLRHPVDYVRSAYVQYVKLGGTMSLKQLLTDATIPGKALPNKLDFQALIKMYQTRFGCENVLVLPYELLVENVEDFLSRLWGFLGVTPAGMPDTTTKNPSVSQLGLSLMRLGNKLGSNRRLVRRRVQLFDRRWLHHISQPLHIKADYLRQFKGGHLYPGFVEILHEENYRIWQGGLARFNYRFG